MIGILIVSHGNLASEMISALEHICGKQENISSVSIFSTDDMEAKRNEMIEKTTVLNKGKGVIIFTDIFGGTPSNLAISLLKQDEVEVIAGVNVPMLVKLAQERGKMSIASAVNAVIEAGKKYITSASQF